MARETVKRAAKLEAMIGEAWRPSRVPYGEILPHGNIEDEELRRALLKIERPEDLAMPMYRELAPLFYTSPEAALHFLQYYLRYTMKLIAKGKYERHATECSAYHGLFMLTMPDRWRSLWECSSGERRSVLIAVMNFYAENYKMIDGKRADPPDLRHVWRDPNDWSSGDESLKV